MIVSEVRAKKKYQILFLSVNISFLSACSYICRVKNGPNFWRANLFVWIRRGDNDDVTQCKIAIYLSKRLEYIGLLKQVNFFFVKSQDAKITKQCIGKYVWNVIILKIPTFKDAYFVLNGLKIEINQGAFLPVHICFFI